MGRNALAYGLTLLLLLLLAAPSVAAPPPAFDRAIAAAKQAMMTDPPAALARSEAALAATRAMPEGPERRVAAATAQWLQGEALTRMTRTDRSGPIIAAALATASRDAPGSKLHGDLLMARAGVSAVSGDIQRALADYQQAYTIFRRAKEYRAQAMAQLNIGSIYSDAGDHERALHYFSESAEIYHGDPSVALSARNNRANALRQLGRLPEAERDFRLALAQARKLDSPLLEARILTNIALTQIRRGRLDAADASIARGLALAGDPAAADWRPFLWAAAAEAARKRGNLGGAATLIDRTFNGVDPKHTTLVFRQAHETAYHVYEGTGDAARALVHLAAYKRLDDEARTLAASTNAALMAARFDFANQDLKITKLKAGQLERDVMIARNREKAQRTLMSTLLVTTAVILALLTFGYLSIRRSRDRVRAANAELSTTNGALEKALKAKTEFLATTSHEIRTPLNGILGMTQVILADRGVEPKLREKIALVQGAGETMKALVDDILDVAKMETGHLAVERIEMDLHKILRDAGRLWADQARDRGLTLTVEMDDAPRHIVEDETRLRQIVFNLMSNAMKFTEKGTVSLVARAEGEPGAETLAIVVADSGIGIDPAHFDTIFESFKQVDGGTTRKFGGTGLGLAICRNLVAAMDGTIGLDSALGRGTTFTIRLPLVRAETPALADDAPTARPTSLKETRLLLVEGNPLAQSILRAVLTPEVAALVLAPNGEAALAALDGQPIDRILADRVSITGEGEASAQAVARLVAAAPGVPITLLTTPIDDAERLALMAHGLEGILTRPIAPAELVAKLKTAAAVETDAPIEPAPVTLAAA